MCSALAAKDFPSSRCDKSVPANVGFTPFERTLIAAPVAFLSQNLLDYPPLFQCRLSSVQRRFGVNHDPHEESHFKRGSDQEENDGVKSPRIVIQEYFSNLYASYNLYVHIWVDSCRFSFHFQGGEP